MSVQLTDPSVQQTSYSPANSGIQYVILICSFLLTHTHLHTDCIPLFLKRQMGCDMRKMETSHKPKIGNKKITKNTDYCKTLYLCFLFSHKSVLHRSQRITSSVKSIHITKIACSAYNTFFLLHLIKSKAVQTEIRYFLLLQDFQTFQVLRLYHLLNAYKWCVH